MFAVAVQSEFWLQIHTGSFRPQVSDSQAIQRCHINNQIIWNKTSSSFGSIMPCPIPCQPCYGRDFLILPWFFYSCSTITAWLYRTKWSASTLHSKITTSLLGSLLLGGLVRREEGHVLETSKSFQNIAAEGDIIAWLVTRVFAFLLVRALPVLEAPLFVSALKEKTSSSDSDSGACFEKYCLNTNTLSYLEWCYQGWTQKIHQWTCV